MTKGQRLFYRFGQSRALLQYLTNTLGKGVAVFIVNRFVMCFYVNKRKAVKIIAALVNGSNLDGIDPHIRTACTSAYV
ncbi:hypothetical protein D3C87_1029840 [compost metagenome]